MPEPSIVAASAHGNVAVDRAEIMDLYARYTADIDTLDEQAWLDHFIADGVLDLGDQRVTGQEQLRGWFVQFRQFAGESLRHFTTNISIDLDVKNGAARGQAYLLLVARGTGTIVSTGTYRDEMILDEGEWRFASRTLTLDSAPEVTR